MRFSDLENARVAILGVGREGQAVWRHIRKMFPHKALSLFSESAIEDRFAKGLEPGVDECHIGPLDVDSLKQHDVCVRSAGISPYRQELRELRALGLKFTTANSLWFAENPGAKTICITGTMGKSTTAALTAHLLTRAGVKTRLAGNIGRPMLDCEISDADWWVIELSSYQISDLEAQPNIAVLLNLSEEHLDWHQGVDRYRLDKLRLARLAVGGRIIANYSDNVLSEGLKGYRNVTWFNRAGGWQAGEKNVFRLPGDSAGQADGSSAEASLRASSVGQSLIDAPPTLPGAHNMQNLAAAMTVVEMLGLDIPQLDHALSSFMGLAHRQQFIGETAGVRYINDSISTTPVSVEAALQTIGFNDVVLLLGGMDRGLDWREFVKFLPDHLPYAIITLPDNGPKIFELLQSAGVKPKGGLHALSGLREAVALAQALVPPNGCVLLSPGAPSFPHFRDFEDRGNQFKKFAGF